MTHVSEEVVEQLIERIADETCVECPGKAHDRMMKIIARLIREVLEEAEGGGA